MKHLLAAAPLLLLLSGCGEKTQQPYFQVLGQAKIEKKAELFRINAMISERDKDRLQSLKAASTKLAEVRDKLSHLEGLEKLSLKTSDAKANAIRPRGCDPDNSYGDKKYPENCDPIQFISTITITIRGEPANAAGSALSLLTSLGVEKAGLSGFEVKDPAAAELEARKKALKNATQRLRPWRNRRARRSAIPWKSDMARTVLARRFISAQAREATFSK